MTRTLDLSVYLVLDPEACGAADPLGIARVAAEAGVPTIQLRAKRATTAERIALGRALRDRLAGTGAALVINDDAEAAVAVGADGLHVGQGDVPPAEARALIGPAMALGLSIETEAQARAVDATLVDHIGAGPVFATATKPDHAAPVGLDGLARIVAASPVPAVAIGGIGAGHAAGVLGAGARGLAVVSAICGQADPGAAAADLLRRVREARA